MGRSVYIAGPVRRGAELWASDVYRMIQEEAAGFDAETILPDSEARLEASGPAEFYRQIKRRVSAASVGFTLFDSGDASAAIEAAMLSSEGKPQMIIARGTEDTPRLLRGLPSVTQVASAGLPRAELADSIRDFLEQNLRSGGRTMYGTATS